MPNMPSRCWRAARPSGPRRGEAGLDRRLPEPDRRAADHRRLPRRARRRRPRPAHGACCSSSGDTAGALSGSWPGRRRPGARSTRRGWRCRPARPTPRPGSRRSTRRRGDDGGLILDQADLAARHQPAGGGAPDAGQPADARPAARQSAALARHALTLARGRGQRPQLAGRLRHRLPGRRPLRRPAPTSARGPMTSATIIRAWSGSAGRRRCSGWAGPPTRRGCSSATPAPRARRRPAPRASTGPSRAATASGQAAQASAWLEQAAAIPTSFTASWRWSGSAALPPPPAALAPSDAAERAAFSRPAARPGGRAISAWSGAGTTRPLFVRALAGHARPGPRARRLAGEFGRQIGRPDIGVWAAREARTAGGTFYARAAFPEVSRSRRLMRATGRSPTASSARKARSSAPRSARPARAA